MNFFCPLPKGTPINANGLNYVRVVRSVLRCKPPGRPADHHEDEPELQGLAPAQHRHVRLHREHQPRPEPAAGQVGSGRLRRRRSSADGARGPRAAVRCEQGPLLRERWSEHRLHRDEHDTAGVLEHEHAQGRHDAVDRPAWSAIRGKFAGFRNDQILPPGLGGYKDLKLYPIKGSDYAKAKALAASAARTSRCTRQHRRGQQLGQVLSTTSPRSAVT